MFFSLIVITCFEFFSNFSFDTFLLIISEYFSLNCFISSSVNLISLNVISYIFSKYLYIFKGFSLTYGSLTTLMLIMMWTYACFYTVFLGAEFNKLINENKKYK